MPSEKPIIEELGEALDETQNALDRLTKALQPFEETVVQLGGKPIAETNLNLKMQVARALLHAAGHIFKTTQPRK